LVEISLKINDAFKEITKIPKTITPLSVDQLFLKEDIFSKTEMWHGMFINAILIQFTVQYGVRLVIFLPRKMSNSSY
jgi:hypothetical protein